MRCPLPFHFQAGITTRGSPVILASSGNRNRRQLPQTPLTPRPAVAYKTAHSSPITMPPTSAQRPVAAASSSGSGRLPRGLSEHNSLLADCAGPSPLPVTRIGSVPSLAAEPRQPLPEDRDYFQDALSTHRSMGRSTAQTLPSSTTPAGAGARTSSSALAQSGRGGVPNGYHFTLGMSSEASSAARGTGGYQDTEKEDWC